MIRPEHPGLHSFRERPVHQERRVRQRHRERPELRSAFPEAAAHSWPVRRERLQREPQLRERPERQGWC